MTAKKPSRARKEIIELVRAMRGSGTLDEATHAKVTAQQAKIDTIKR